MLNVLKKMFKKSKKEKRTTIQLDNARNSLNFEKSQTNLVYIAHDLKNPIIACQKALEIIKKEKLGPLNKSQLDIINLCNNSLIFSRYLVENILCSYKYFEENTELNITSFDLVVLIKECINEFNIFAIEKNINIVLNIPESKIIIADKQELKRVILNLFYNAISYSKLNTEIEITMYFNENNINFSIKNIGNYIPPNDIKVIFDKNITLKNKYSNAGTGLGLFLSKKIILAHNGEIFAKSYPDNSNIFGFKLPCN